MNLTLKEFLVRAGIFAALVIAATIWLVFTFWPKTHPTGEIMGVRLGMSVGEAEESVKKAFPDGLEPLAAERTGVGFAYTNPQWGGHDIGVELVLPDQALNPTNQELKLDPCIIRFASSREPVQMQDGAECISVAASPDSVEVGRVIHVKIKGRTRTITTLPAGLWVERKD